MDRRNALLTLAGITSLSGCSQMRAAVRRGPPYFEDVRISAPENAKVGQEVELEISAKNTGGREGDFTSTLTIGEGALSIERSVEIKNVPVAQRKSTTVGPITLPDVRDYQFRITDYNAEHVISASAASLEVGESISLPDITLSVENPTVIESAARETYDGVEIVPSNGVLLAVDVKTDVSADNGKPDVSSFSLDGSEPVDIEVFPRDATRLPYADVAENSTGYLVFQALRSNLDAGSKVEFRTGYDDVEDVVWELADISTPDTSIETVKFPETAQKGKTFSPKITARNDGDAEGRVIAILEQETGSGSHSEWEAVDYINRPVPAGESATVEPNLSSSELGGQQYRLRSNSGIVANSSIEITPVILDFGQTYSFGDRWDVTVLSTEPILADSVTFGSGYSTETHEADSGNGILLVKASRTNTEGGREIPRYNSFSAEVDGESYDPVEFTFQVEISSPVQGFVFGHRAQSVGETLTGWIAIEVPDSVDPDAVDIKCAPTGYDEEAEDAAIWSNYCSVR